MHRATVFAALLLSAPCAVDAQALSTLHIKVVLTDANGATTPVPRHALLISDNPSTAAPRLVTTAVDGTAEVKLQPGNYTVESDRPVAFHGKAYQWTQIVDIVAGRDAVLELSSKNAENAGADAVVNAPSVEAEPSLLLPRWQDSVVGVWSPTTRASGFVFDAKGFVVTNQRAIGAAASAEVQLGPSVKVAARVLAADAASDVAVLWVNPGAVATVKPIPLGCAQPKTAAEKQAIFTIGVPMRQPVDLTSGTLSELLLTRGTEGGPVFTADGNLVGMTSLASKGDDRRRGSARVVQVADLCRVVASSEQKAANASPPPAAYLPIEPDWPLPVDAFKNAADHRVGSLNPYQMSTSTFDVALVTPIMTYGVQYQSEQMSRRRTAKDARTIEIDPVLVRPVFDFANWSDYVDDFPSVLLVRVTPKQVEGLWTKVARGAAQTQGVAVPPITHAKAGFSRLRAYCGDAEITPIHPFIVEHRLSDTEAAYEGLYVFAPDAFGPSCATVRLVLYAEKDPEKGESRQVDPSIVEQIRRDFTLYPEANAPRK
jgi:S1-C subfamily serine protease